MEGKSTLVGFAQQQKTIADVTPTSSPDDSTIITSLDHHHHPVARYIATAVALIVTWCPPVLIVLGTIANLLMTFVLARMLWSRALSTSLYPLLSGLLDLVVLYMFCGTDWFYHFTGYEVRDIAMTSSNSICRLFPFASDFALHLSVWLTVAMTLETAVIQVSPERAERVNKLDIARAVVLFLVVIIVCVNAHCFWTYGLVKGDFGSSSSKFEVCTVARPGNQQNDNFFKVVWPLTIIVFVDLSPIVIILMCVVTIMIKRHRSPDQLTRLRTVWKSNNIDPKTSEQLHRSFVTIALMFLVLFTPTAVCDISAFLTTTFSSSSSSPASSSSSSSSYLLTESAGHESSVMMRKDRCSAVSRFLVYLFCSVSKVLAFLIRCPSFRRELFSSLTGCCQCKPSWQHHKLSTDDRMSVRTPPVKSVYPLASLQHDALTPGGCCTEAEKLKALQTDSTSKLLVKIENG